jgi:hypothetical protein
MNLPRETIRRFGAMAVSASCAVFGLGQPALAEANRVVFPKLDTLTHYTTVRRGNVTEHISTSREAIEAVQKGLPVPDGTQFVLADYRDEKIFRYFVMQKGAGFGAVADERRRAGDWQFQWYWPDRTINLKENTTRCVARHASRKEQDYLYTAGRLPEFRGAPLE